MIRKNLILIFEWLLLVSIVSTFIGLGARTLAKAQTPQSKPKPKVTKTVKPVKKVNTVAVPAKYVGEFSMSHYCSCSKCTGGHVRTATGTIPKVNRTIAADPRVIPLNSIVYIEGLGVYVVEDTGGAIKGHVLDVYVADHQTALNLGTRGGKKFKVYVLR